MLKQLIKYRLDLKVYYSCGSLLNTHVEAYTEKELIDKKTKFVEEQKTKKTTDGKLSVELITVSGLIKTTVDYNLESRENIQLVDLVTNSYAPLSIQGFKR